MKAGILDWRVHETPIAVVDLETTGFTMGSDRVIELSIVHIDPGKKPRLVFDSLINPHRPVAATHIHGISDEDVADAPRFEDISGAIIRLLYNRVVASFNVYFDINFLKYEFSRVGIRALPPHLCLMYLGCLAGINGRKNLSELCRHFKIPANEFHVAGQDALAASKLWSCYIDHFSRKGVKKFGDFLKLKSYKFMESFYYSPYMPPLGKNLPAKNLMKSRFYGEQNTLAKKIRRAR